MLRPSYTSRDGLFYFFLFGTVGLILILKLRALEYTNIKSVNSDTVTQSITTVNNPKMGGKPVFIVLSTIAVFMIAGATAFVVKKKQNQD